MPTNAQKKEDDKKAFVAWDSCIFLHRIQRTPSIIKTLEQITYAAEKGKLMLVTSALSIAEVAKVDAKKPLTPKQEKMIKEFFENDFIELVTVDRVIGEFARSIVRDHALKPSDAVIVACAIMGEAPVLHTFDEKMLKRNGLIGLPGKPPLRIETPTPPDQQDLFAGDKGNPDDAGKK